jgi:Family of unknown function (DUF5317)
LLLLYAVAFGLIAGLLTRGRLSELGTVKIRYWPIALAGLAFQVLLFSSPLAATVGDLGPALYVGSTAVVLGALFANIRQPGFWLIVVGALANLIAIVANGGQMPASAEAWAVLTGAPELPATDFSNAVIATPDTPFYFLGDLFVLPRPFPFANVFSIGDALIGLGGAWFVIAVMHGKGRRHVDPSQVPARTTRRTPTTTATQA